MILVFGMAGSGKSTQVELLAEEMDWTHFSMGAYLRSLDDPTIQDQLARGVMVKTSITNEAVAKAYTIAEETGKKLILDGYPREKAQADWLVAHADRYPIEAVLVIDVAEDEVMRRLMVRGRPDDTKSAIAQRIEIFKTETKEVLDGLAKSGVKIIHVDGNGTIEQTHQNVMRAIGQNVAAS